MAGFVKRVRRLEERREFEEQTFGKQNLRSEKDGKEEEKEGEREKEMGVEEYIASPVPWDLGRYRIPHPVGFPKSKLNGSSGTCVRRIRVRKRLRFTNSIPNTLCSLFYPLFFCGPQCRGNGEAGTKQERAFKGFKTKWLTHRDERSDSIPNDVAKLERRRKRSGGENWESKASAGTKFQDIFGQLRATD